MTTEPLVVVDGLSVAFPAAPGGGLVRAVTDLSFTLPAGGALGVVGESGSGKSTAAYALLGLHRGTGARVTGSVRVAGHDVPAASDAELRRLRGGVAAMVFQDPLSRWTPTGDRRRSLEGHRVHGGSWNTMAATPPRRRRSSASDAAGTSWPATRTEPVT
ncbi:ATP-binding cassette domain-containing protein, partial [Streptomyces cinnamoneus]|uniref:ATP-binding cassette domain-containing protein n=1 Tax=Streptomyces cinnamoneus TaxID=53446 RepID=UPI001EFE26F4